MLLTRYGIREWGWAGIIALAATVVILLFPWWFFLIVIWLAWLAIAAFFRDPVRHTPEELEPEVYVSPADGVISAIEKLDSHEATGDQPAVCIRIFLSVLDVHLNRAPCDATVVDMIHRPGQYLDARTEESAKVNESNLIVMDRHGERIGVRQVSGAVARRIVCAVEEDQQVKRGERIGMIKFGSTAELILPRPDAVQVMVEKGDRVKAGLTPLARQSLGYEVADHRDENQPDLPPIDLSDDATSSVPESEKESIDDDIRQRENNSDSSPTGASS